MEDVDKRKPKLHLKAQLLMNRAAPERPEAKADWPMLIERAVFATGAQHRGRRGVRRASARSGKKTAGSGGSRPRAGCRSAPTPEDVEKADFGYLTVGSHNMDYRGMMMDGEVLYVTSGRGIMVGFRDLLTILGISTWVDDPRRARGAGPGLQRVAAAGGALHQVRAVAPRGGGTVLPCCLSRDARRRIF